MLEQVLDRIDQLDLTRLHNVVAFLGVMMSVYVMMLTSYEQEDRADPLWLQWSRRLALATVATGYLWSLSYSSSRKWEPWPPEIMLMFGILFVMGVRGIAIHLRIWREGHRAFPPPLPVSAMKAKKD